MKYSDTLNNMTRELMRDGVIASFDSTSDYLLLDDVIEILTSNQKMTIACKIEDLYEKYCSDPGPGTVRQGK